ncbi:MAG: dienelactone hydrolase family protein [Acidobacteria bacterium]|nr:dienelactone hydrolase family protein [Acidobacteriota bacterium]
MNQILREFAKGARALGWLLVGLSVFVYAQQQEPRQAEVVQQGLLISQNHLDIETCTVRFRTVRNIANPQGELARELDQLAADVARAQGAGQTSEVRRLIAKGFTRLGGQPWTPRDEFKHGLILRTDSRVLDPAQPVVARLGQIYPAAYAPTKPFTLRVALHAVDRSLQRLAQPGAEVKALGSYEALNRDWLDAPFGLVVNLSGVKEGGYLLVAELLEGDQPFHKVWAGINVVPGYLTQRAEIERRLNALKARENSKLSVHYPFDFADKVNLGAMEPGNYNFSAELELSRQLLASLEAGKDPLYQATGSSKRHYLLKEANEVLPVRLYVPKGYDAQRKWPLIVALHGLGGTEETMLRRDDGLLAKLADEHGYIVVTPLGFRVNGAYGQNAERMLDPARKRIVTLSEADVLAALAMVRQEYRIDDDRTYLMGHSMGGNGTWYLGAKHAMQWAAIAPIAAGGMTPQQIDLEALRQTPVFVSHGAKDMTALVERSRVMTARLKELGYTCEYFELADGTHESIVVPAMRQIFAFFDKHKRRSAAAK